MSKSTQSAITNRDGEMAQYHRHGMRLPASRLALIHERPIGKLAGRTIWFVHGERVRDLVDIDFVAGGNPGRYAYCPENEIWLEEEEKFDDVAATLLHENTECALMEDHGKSYDQAHQAASQVERRMRQDIENGNFRVRGITDIVPAVRDWQNKNS